jgi:nucleoside-diphosphate-sugar epimerase
VQADVLQPDGLIKAAVGCEYIIHCAGPMVTQVPKSKVHSLLVSPYVKATENVLAAATAARVKKVIYTSGVNAATANNTEFGKNHIMTEEDWNVMASEDYMPLSYAKRLAEQRAWQLYDSQPQDHRWELITILPGFLLGPPVIPSSSPSIQFCLDMLHGKFARSMPPLGIATVDVRDAAAAHVLAALLPRAKGRYLCLQRHTNIIEVIKDIQPRWPHKLVGPATPKWLLKGVANLTTLITWDRVVAQYGTVLKFDCSKIVRDLGLKFHSASEALHAMGKRLVQMDMCETIQISNIQ